MTHAPPSAVPGLHLAKGRSGSLLMHVFSCEGGYFGLAPPPRAYAEVLHVSPRTIRRWFRQLAAAGVLHIDDDAYVLPLVGNARVPFGDAWGSK